MRAAPHTPGPWRFNEKTQTIVSNQSHPIATLSAPFHRQLEGGRTGNDGPLLAASTEMLDALYDALPYVEDVLNDKAQLSGFKRGVVERHARQIRAAIAKAEGGDA